LAFHDAILTALALAASPCRHEDAMKRSTIIVLTIYFLIFDLHHACAQEKSNLSDVYRARYIISGYLVRAGAVCENDVNRMIELGLQFISSAELKSIGKAFPRTTERWMTEGAERFNSEVVKGGITSACNSALASSKQTAGATRISREEPSDERRRTELLRSRGYD
jgi:hypothetical protein